MLMTKKFRTPLKACSGSAHEKVPVISVKFTSCKTCHHYAMPRWMMGENMAARNGEILFALLKKKYIVVHLLDDKHDKLANTVRRHETTVSMVYKVKLLLGLLFSQVNV